MHNPILKKLGFGPKDKVVVIHADDVGMCETTLDSFAELIDFGIVSCGSVMVPCPGFERTIEWALEHPDADLGVHLTLTSEWDDYRWGPVTHQEHSSGMLDGEGCFFKQCKPLWENANVLNVYEELKGQVSLAKDRGLSLSHLDAHMFSCMVPFLFQAYQKVGKEFDIPLLLKRGSWKKQDPHGLNIEAIEKAEGMGLPVFDHLVYNSLEQDTEVCLAASKKVIKELPVGLSYYIIHPAKENDEIKSIAHDWKGRVADYLTFKDKRLKQYIKDEGVHIISFRELMDAQ